MLGDPVAETLCGDPSPALDMLITNNSRLAAP